MDYLLVIKEKRIQVAPVIKDGEIITWTAGIVVEHPNGNYIPNHLFARAKTLEEAVEKLLSGQTLYRLGRDGSLLEN